MITTRRVKRALSEDILLVEWSTIDRRKRRVEKPLEVAARRLFVDQEKQIQERLPVVMGRVVEQKSVLTLAAQLFDLRAWKKTTADLFAPLFARVFRSGFNTGAERTFYTGSLSADDPEVIDFIQRQTAKIRGINDVTLDDLSELIADGLREGDTIGQLSRRITTMFDIYSDKRADLIAQTEGVAAFERGQQLSFERAGVEEKAWLSRRDGRVRQPPTSKFDHAAPDGQRQPIAEPFIISGETLMFPGDFTNGASAGNTIRCRCTSLPMGTT